MKMLKSHKRLLIGDYVQWLGLPTLATALCIGAALTPQAWGLVKIGLLLGVPLGLWTIGITVLIKSSKIKPTFLADINWEDFRLTAAIWHNSSQPETAASRIICNALRIIVETFPREDWKRLSQAIDQATIETSKDPIKEWGIWSFGEGKAGLQKGKSIIFHWPTGKSISSTAFAHEILHLLDEKIMGRYDPEHGNHLWWDKEKDIKKALEEKGL